MHMSNTNTARAALAKTTRGGTMFLSFRLLDGGNVRVLTYATWTDYRTDLELSAAEAIDCWASMVADGMSVEAYEKATGPYKAAA